MTQVCNIAGCLNPSHGRGWCKAHYMRWWKYGNPVEQRTKGIKCSSTCSCARHRVPEDRRSRISATTKGIPKTAETRRRMVLARRNRPPYSKASRAKMSAAKKGRTQPWLYTPEVRAKISAANKGRKCPSECREQIALSVAKLYAEGRYSKLKNTDLEQALRRLLDEAGFDFEEQVRFGRYVVDAWVPSHKLVFEADGFYWHNKRECQRPGQQAKRNSVLCDKYGILAVIHLVKHDLDPWVQE